MGRRRAPIVAVFDGFEFTEGNFSRDRIRINGQLLKRHRNGGGWVPVDQDEHDETKPFVAESVYVGPEAKVLENARALGGARLDGNAVLAGNAKIGDGVCISDNGLVNGNAQLSGTRIVQGYQLVFK